MSEEPWETDSLLSEILEFRKELIEWIDMQLVMIRERQLEGGFEEASALPSNSGSVPVRTYAETRPPTTPGLVAPPGGWSAAGSLRDSVTKTSPEVSPPAPSTSSSPPSPAAGAQNQARSVDPRSRLDALAQQLKNRLRTPDSGKDPKADPRERSE
jgi:hypothetical protein